MALRIPGVIVTIVNDTGIVAPPAFERYPVIIGEGDPYRLIENREIVRTLGSADPIPTVTTVNEIVSVGDLPGIVEYTDGVDYTLSGTSTISWLPGGSRPTGGNSYYMTYTENRPASAYLPTLYFDENLVYADHGNAIRTNGNINDVSKGASLAFAAGARGVIVLQLDLRTAVDPDSPTNNELETAFIASVDQLNEISDYKLFLVPMSSGTLNTTTAATIMFNHAVIASQPARKQERTVLSALPMGQTYSQIATYAQGFAHERMVVPAIKNTTCNVVGFTPDYDTRYYCAALAGLLCSAGIGINVSDEVVPNITFDSNFTVPEADYLVQRGVSPAKIKGTVARNILAITTDTTNALTEDLGVQDVKDYVKKYWREGLWNLYKNKPITPSTVVEVKNSSTGIMDELKADNIIAAYRRLSATQDRSEPRKILVGGQVQPAFGMQWMDVTFTFVLSFSS